MGTVKKRATKAQLKSVRDRLNPAFSSIMVYGMGCDSDVAPTYDSHITKMLLSSKLDKSNEWSLYLSRLKPKKENRYLKLLSDKVTEQQFYLATKYVLKTSIVDSIKEIKNTKGFLCLELNGNVAEALDLNTNTICDISSPDQINSSMVPTFPAGNYNNKKRLVAKFEESYERDVISIALFLGCSGQCVVTESLYNRALVNKTFIVVVNDDPDCFMHSLANVSIVGDVNTFFDDLHDYYLGSS